MRELDQKYVGKNSKGFTAKRAVRIRIGYAALEDLLKAGFGDPGFRINSDAPPDLKIVALFPYVYGEDHSNYIPDLLEVLAVSSEFEPVEDDIPLRVVLFTKEQVNDD